MAAKSSEEKPEDEALNVVEAWNRVLRDMPAITKDNRMQAGGGYNFRSIEQFTAEAAGLFAKHGVIVIPRVREIEYVDVGKTQSGAVQFEARGIWDWDIYGPGGAEDVIHASSAGQGRDSADKAANKAATAAFKYLLMPALMVSDRKDDPDHERPETDGPPPPPSKEDQERAEKVEMIYQLCVDLRNMDGAEGPHINALRETVGGRTINEIKTWIDRDPDIAEDVVTTLIKQYKGRAALDREEAELRLEHGDVPSTDPEPPTPTRPPKAPSTRKKAGSAVTPEVEAAADAVKKVFPGTTEE
jgi:ERF superfamily